MLRNTLTISIGRHIICRINYLFSIIVLSKLNKIPLLILEPIYFKKYIYNLFCILDIFNLYNL